MSTQTYTTDSELIAWVAAWRPDKGMSDVPGVPLSRFSLSGGTMADVSRLVADGHLEFVKGGRDDLYTYVRVTMER